MHADEISVFNYLRSSDLHLWLKFFAFAAENSASQLQQRREQRHRLVRIFVYRRPVFPRGHFEEPRFF
jgi:hypothetical protein